MVAETGVTVTARVVGEVSSMATTVATTTTDVSWWLEIVKSFVNHSKLDCKLI